MSTIMPPAANSFLIGAPGPLRSDSLHFPDDQSLFRPEKYSLRQRQKRTILPNDPGADDGSSDECPRKPTRPSTKAPPKSTTTNTSVTRPKASKKKPKTKAAPLSKYRRKTANARERTRMREINSAFENLRKFVPLSLDSETPTSTNEKLTKITTLRLAMKYIQKLNDMLCHGGTDVVFDENNLFETTNNHISSLENEGMCLDDIEANHKNNSNISNNNNNSHMNNNNNNNHHKGYELNLNLDDTSKDLFNELLMTAYGTTTVDNKPRTSKTATLKSRTSYSKTSTPFSKDRYSRITNSKAMLNPGLHSPIDHHMDLGLLLESDGESLHLSEPCLSPLSKGVRSSFGCSARSAMDLGLLLDSDNDSLELSEPCLSPLNGLDTLNPFGDLIHGGFAEHANLDMYLT